MILVWRNAKISLREIRSPPPANSKGIFRRADFFTRPQNPAVHRVPEKRRQTGLVDGFRDGAAGQSAAEGRPSSVTGGGGMKTRPGFSRRKTALSKYPKLSFFLGRNSREIGFLKKITF